MATRRATNLSGLDVPSDIYGLAVPAPLHEAIEESRDRLSRIDSLLGCVSIAMEHPDAEEDAPYYPDVVREARQLLKEVLRGLDSVALKERILRNQIREDYRLPPAVSTAPEPAAA